MTPGPPAASAAPLRMPTAGHDEESPAHRDGGASPHADLVGAVVWIAFGVAVAVASWRMDRLENQDVNPYTVPGLLPGFLGVAVILFGGLLLARALRDGALDAGTPRGRHMTGAELRRLGIVIVLCVVFGVGLVGHGLPFWLAAALYVSSTIAILQYPQRKAEHQVGRGLAIALVIGLCAGIAITLVFQEFFLVRLP